MNLIESFADPNVSEEAKEHSKAVLENDEI
jgi:hypothetical protein